MDCCCIVGTTMHDDDDVLVRKVVCVGVVNASDIEDVASTNAAAKAPILLCDD